MLSTKSSVSAPVVSRNHSAHRQRRQSDAQTRTGRLVHLTEDHGRLVDNRATGFADLGFLHFEPKVVAFARALADAGEYGITAVLTGDTRDELGQNDRLAQTGTAEQTGFTAADERREQVDNLDARFEDLGFGRQFGERRRIAMDRPEFLGIDRAAPIDRIAQEVEHAAECLFAHGYLARACRCRPRPCRGPARRWSRGRRSGRGCRRGAAALRP